MDYYTKRPKPFAFIEFIVSLPSHRSHRPPSSNPPLHPSHDPRTTRRRCNLLPRPIPPCTRTLPRNSPNSPPPGCAESIHDRLFPQHSLPSPQGASPLQNYEDARDAKEDMDRREFMGALVRATLSKLLSLPILLLGTRALFSRQRICPPAGARTARSTSSQVHPIRQATFPPPPRVSSLLSPIDSDMSAALPPPPAPLLRPVQVDVVFAQQRRKTPDQMRHVRPHMLIPTLPHFSEDAALSLSLSLLREKAAHHLSLWGRRA